MPIGWIGGLGVSAYGGVQHCDVSDPHILIFILTEIYMNIHGFS